MAMLIDVLQSGVIDSSGNPLDGGIVYIYDIGTTTPVTVYQDSDLTLPHSNPLTLDSVGKAEVYINDDVRVVIQTSAGVTVSDFDVFEASSSNSTSEVFEISSDVQGDLIPLTDDTYVVGTETKRWAEGYFVELFGTLKQSMIESAGANTPGWVSNIGVTYNAGVFKITDAQGADLSDENPGYVTAPSTTAGQLTTIKVTYSFSFQDSAGASSDLIGTYFGITSTSNWSEDMPFFIYVVNRGNTDADGVDGNSVICITRNFAMNRSPSSGSNIGDTATIPASNSAANILIMADVTTANYTSLNTQIMGCFKMRYTSASTDFTVQALNYLDGIGQSQLTKFYSKKWTFPVSQNEAVTGTYFSNAGGGTPPVFTASSDYDYFIYGNGDCVLVIELVNDGGTDGSGAFNMLLCQPYQNAPGNGNSSAIVGYGLITYGGVTDPAYAKGSGNSQFTLVNDLDANFKYSDFTNADRDILLQIQSKPFGG